jgi:hypothetical protein
MSERMKTLGLFGIAKNELVFTALARTWTVNAHSTRNVVREPMVYSFVGAYFQIQRGFYNV